MRTIFSRQRGGTELSLLTSLLLWATSCRCCWGSGLLADDAIVGNANDKRALPRRLQDDGAAPPADYIQNVFSFEFHLFSNSDEDQVDFVNSKVKEFLETTISDDAPVFVGPLEAVVLALCDPADHGKAEQYTGCTQFLTKVNMWLDPSVNKEKARRVALEEVRAYIEQFNMEQAGTMNVVYEYPIFVKSSIILTLVGAFEKMDVDEQDLFLRNFRVGFEPIMLAGAYEYGDARIVVQHAGTKTDDRRRRQLQSNSFESSPDNFNKVELFVRGTCSGPETCFDDNFGRFLTREMRGFAPQFLTILKTIGPDEAILYFDQIIRIETESEDVQIATIAPGNSVKIQPSPDEEGIPAWIWIILGLVVLILGCATGWVALRIKTRRARTAQYSAEKNRSTDGDGVESPERASNGNNVSADEGDLAFKEQDVVMQLEEQ